jgi:alpha-L-fucosidase
MKKWICLWLVLTGSFYGYAQALKESDLVLPTARQVEWANAEIGALIHYDVQVYEPSYKWRKDFNYQPSPAIFNPDKLNTDQWIKAAKEAGATYVVLVAKHCSGFSLWPTEAHEYSIKNSPWKNGKGDIVADFIASCKKYNIKPGIYASAAANAYCKVDNPGLVINRDPVAQKKYNEIVMQQLTELWTRYGNLFEIWFDGGVLPPSKGGPPIATLLKKLQPDAVVFQGPYGFKNLVRWVGNEEGLAAYPCWATADSTTQADGTVVMKGLHGNPNGKVWCPGEADVPLRSNKSFEGGWFWKEGQDDVISSLDLMMHRYYNSVGRNTNLLIGIVIDKHGLVPDADVARLSEFGQEVKKQFSTPLASTQGKGSQWTLKWKANAAPKFAVIQENISKGERIRAYQLEGLVNGNWESLAQGSSVGHKRIEVLPSKNVQSLRLKITDSVGEVQLLKFAVY